MLRPTVKPAVEVLEVRDVPSVTIQTLNNGHTLKITGNSDWDNVQIIQNDQDNTLSVYYSTLAKPGQVVSMALMQKTFSSSAITAINVNLGDGNDSFDYSLAMGTNLTYAKQLTVNTGAGDDTVRIDLAAYYMMFADPGISAGESSVVPPDVAVYSDSVTNAVASQVYDSNIDVPASSVKAIYSDAVPVSSTGEDSAASKVTDGTVYTYPSPAYSEGHSAIMANVGITIDSGNGNDQVDVFLGEVAERKVVRLSVNLGNGDDHFSLTNDYRINARASVLVDVNGGQGNDQIDSTLNGAIADRALVDILFRGAAGNDTMSVNSNGTMMGRLNVREFGGAGADTLAFTSDSTASTKSAAITFQLMGEAGNDTLTYQGSPATDPMLISALMDGGTGKNTAKMSGEVDLFNFDQIIHL